MSLPKKEEIIRKVMESGVVGAGGAGFPTYIKLNSNVDVVIANIAECEPLLYKDKELARNFPEKIIEGITLAMRVTEAKKGIVGIKKKEEQSIKELSKYLKGNISICTVDDYYPVGDEILLIYEVTGKTLPEGGLPVDNGVLVLNAETLYNISNSLESIAVTTKFVTITGEVKKPVTIKVPVGTRIKYILEQLNISYENKTIFTDGLMMGKPATTDTPITKVTSCIILLPDSHPYVLKRTRELTFDRRIIKSACDQCSYCTEFCPRYLIGHNVQPHRVMRTLSLIGGSDQNNALTEGCVECGLCTFFSCPEDLSPHVIMKEVKKKSNGNKNQSIKRGIHPMRDYRKVPSWKLKKRLGVEKYDKTALLSEIDIQPDEIHLFLKQHFGEDAKPVISIGDRVKKGDVVAETEKDEIGTRIHTSISGTISEINQKEMVVVKDK
jgi:Na+-translocating ferredoxin:NAD+ oxidoreductase RnfC subunit